MGKNWVPNHFLANTPRTILTVMKFSYVESFRIEMTNLLPPLTFSRLFLKTLLALCYQMLSTNKIWTFTVRFRYISSEIGWGDSEFQQLKLGF